MREQEQECKEVLSAWDNNELIQTIEMGGLGPGYEQALHMCAMEMLRYMLDNPMDFEKMEAADEEAEEYWKQYKSDQKKYLYRPDSICNDLGLSGAQAGAASNISFMFAKHGPKKAINMAEDDRHIMVSKNFPGDYS